MAPPRVDARAHGAVTPENPWLGLQSFDEDTRTYFFGREDAVVELCERIRHKTLTILFSQSGIGKTSILRAGVIPTLRNDGYTPAFIRFDYGDHAPSLEAQLLAVLAPNVPAIGDAPIDSLWRAAHDPTSALLADAAPKFVVIIDQFEEIFTLGDRPGRRPASQAFIDMLACLVENRVPSGLRQQLEGDEDLAERLDYAARPIKIVLSLREDFLHALERWRRVMPSLMDNRFELGPLDGPQALRAVLEPGRRRCIEHPEMRPIIDRDDAALIVAFVAGAPPETPLEAIEAVPPLLSLLCAELNHERLRSGNETIRFERGSERPDAILENFYESAVAAYPSVVRAFIEDRLLSSDGYRESAALSTAASLIEGGGMAHDGAVQALDELVDARLLVVEERDGVRRIELAHDVLCPIVRRRRDARHELEADAQRR
jgi:hypothetical protein